MLPAANAVSEAAKSVAKKAERKSKKMSLHAAADVSFLLCLLYLYV